MRDYGVVSPQFWIGKTGKSLRGNAEAQLLALYLMTSPHANMIGVFHCPVLYMAHETGIPFEGASEALRSLVEANFCTYDADREVVFVHSMAKYQIGDELKEKDNRIVAVKKAVQSITSPSVQAAFLAIYGEVFRLQKAEKSEPKKKPHASPLQAPSKPGTGTGTETGTEKETPLTPQGGAPDGAGGVELAFPNLPDDAEVLDALPTSAGTVCTTAGAACLALKAAGIADTNPSNPKLRALLTAGADLQEFIGAAQAAVAAGNGRFAYVLAAVAGERERAAKLASKLHQGQMPVAETPYQRSMRERVQQFAPSIARKAPEAKTQSAVEFFNAIEVPTRTVGAIE